MPHAVSISIALARTAANVPGPIGKAKDWEAAPGSPRRRAEPLSRMNSLPDLDSDSASDSSDEDTPSTGRQRSGVSDASAVARAAAAVAGAAGMQAKGSRQDRSDPPLPRQPLLWMGCKCHWQRDDAAPKPQQVELAHCSAAAAVVELDTSPLPPVPPELSRLMPSGLPAASAAEQQRKLPPEAEAPVGRLRAELAHSQAGYQTMLRALHRKTQECESLTGVVRDLTDVRAKAAAGRSALQQRCMALLDDVARLGRVADLARRGQADSCAAAEASATARLEAEGEAADARREAAALEQKNVVLATTNQRLARRVATLEQMAAASKVNGGGGGTALTRPLSMPHG